MNKTIKIIKNKDFEIIPNTPNPNIPDISAVKKCSECGLVMETVMGYVCSRQNCPCYPRITC